MYAPGETATIQVERRPPDAALFRLTLRHLEEAVLTAQAPASGSCSLQLPERDFTGYLLEVQALNADGAVVAEASTAVDVSSQWTTFPRNG